MHVSSTDSTLDSLHDFMCYLKAITHSYSTMKTPLKGLVKKV